MKQFKKQKHVSEEQAFRAAAMTFRHENGLAVVDIDSELDVFNHLIGVIRITKRIIDKPEEFKFTRRDFEKVRTHQSRTESSASNRKRLLALLDWSHPALTALIGHHHIHPLYTLFVESFGHYGLLAAQLRDLGQAEQLIGKLIGSLNAALLHLAESSNTKDWKRLEKNFRRNANKNAHNLVTQLNLLSRKHARILVIRIDLSFTNGAGVERHAASLAKISGDGIYPVDTERTYDLVKKAREKYWKAVRKSFGKGLIGYASKLEYGLARGFHLHALVFLDGSMHREDITNGVRLGEIWKKCLPDGVGSFYLCNAHTEKYASLGVGKFEYKDEEFLIGYTKMVEYLTKPDHFIQLTLPGRDRAFHRSFPPKMTAKKRGRTRRKCVTQVDSASDCVSPSPHSESLHLGLSAS